MDKFIKSVLLLSSLSLVGCVTQNYGNDSSQPIVQNESSQNELAMTRITLGLQYLKTGKTSQAKLNLEKAKYYAPNLVQVHTAFAHFYDSVGEPEQAIASYEKALSIDKDDADTRNNYGVFLCKQNRYEEAEKQFLSAIAIPSYILVAKSYENLALCQLKAKNFEKANTYLEKALGHAPANSSILLEMMRLQYVKANYISARNYLSRFEKATRRIKPSALALAFKIYQKQHNSKAAKNYANMLLKMFPNSFEAKQYLLNELSEIEEDRLAKEYTENHGIPKKKKRVVVLKPKQAISDVVQELKVKEIDTNVNDQTSETASNIEKTVIKQGSNTLIDKSLTDSLTVENKATKSVKASDEKVTEIKKVYKPKNGSQATLSLPFHSVKKGESLFSISKRYNIQLRFLMRWNGLNSKSVIHIGDVIYLADPKKAAKLRG